MTTPEPTPERLQSKSPPLKGGMKFGKLTLIKRSHLSKNRSWIWLCRCDCGAEKSILGVSLTNGHTISCGCYRSEATSKHKTIHGNATRTLRTKEYRIWIGMISRCGNTSDKSYEDYGGRGITVCPEWRESFGSFLSAMGKCPEGLSIDRINNNEGYFPGNCKWSTSKEQAANRRTRRPNKKPRRGSKAFYLATGGAE